MPPQKAIMKTITLKKVPITLQGQEDIFDYKTFLQMLLETPENPERGADITEIRKSIRILDALDEIENDVLVLEDADFAYVLQRVRSAKFVTANKVFVEFVEDFENAE